MKDYSDTLAIDRIWHANAQKHGPNTQTAALGYSNSSKKYSNVTKSMPCTYYNQGSCLQANLMRQGGYCTSTFVLHVLPPLAVHFHIRKLIAKIKINNCQKTTQTEVHP